MSRPTILVTGAAGFIGSHVVPHMLPLGDVVVLDKLTDAGHLVSLFHVLGRSDVQFVQGDITDAALVDSLFRQHQFQGVVHLAAESHVDRSIAAPAEFIQTNVMGTCVLLQVASSHWTGRMEGKCFYHVSTDEVYGTLGAEGKFTEDTPYSPRSPYSASKAASDHLVRAFHETYGLPVKISNCSNNYGPRQFPEKLLPVCILNLMTGKPLPVYGQGLNVRDWLYVEDHARAIALIYERGRVGETYNVGGDCECANLDLVKQLCTLADEKFGRPPGTSAGQIQFVTDRAGHDFRYAIDFSKLQQELGWRPQVQLQEGLKATLDWYVDNQAWTEAVLQPESSAV